MNPYSYCGNNPGNMVDPTGLYTYTADFWLEADPDDSYGFWLVITSLTVYDGGFEVRANSRAKFDSIYELIYELDSLDEWFTNEWIEGRPAWALTNLSGNSREARMTTFWYLEVLNRLGCDFDYAALVGRYWVRHKIRIDALNYGHARGECVSFDGSWVYWSEDIKWNGQGELKDEPAWFTMGGLGGTALPALAHELQHIFDIEVRNDAINRGELYPTEEALRQFDIWSQWNAINTGSGVRRAIINLCPGLYSVPDKYTVDYFMRPQEWLGAPEPPARPW